MMPLVTQATWWKFVKCNNDIINNNRTVECGGFKNTDHKFLFLYVICDYLNNWWISQRFKNLLHKQSPRCPFIRNKIKTLGKFQIRQCAYHARTFVHNTLLGTDNIRSRDRKWLHCHTGKSVYSLVQIFQKDTFSHMFPLASQGHKSNFQWKGRTGRLVHSYKFLHSCCRRNHPHRLKCRKHKWLGAIWIIQCNLLL